MALGRVHHLGAYRGSVATLWFIPFSNLSQWDGVLQHFSALGFLILGGWRCFPEWAVGGPWWFPQWRTLEVWFFFLLVCLFWFGFFAALTHSELRIEDIFQPPVCSPGAQEQSCAPDAGLLTGWDGGAAFSPHLSEVPPVSGALCWYVSIEESTPVILFGSYWITRVRQGLAPQDPLLAAALDPRCHLLSFRV